MKRLVILPEAYAELDEALQWYAEQEADLPLKLLEDVERTLDNILTNVARIL